MYKPILCIRENIKFQVHLFFCCFDTEEILLKTHLERLSFLTKSSNNVDAKDVHAKLGDNVRLYLLTHVCKCVYMATLFT